MADRTTNGQLAERMAGIEATLKHMATREDMAALRQDVRNIEQQLPVFNRAGLPELFIG